MTDDADDEGYLIVFGVAALLMGTVLAWAKFGGATIQFEKIRGGWLPALLYSDLGIALAFAVGVVSVYYGDRLRGGPNV